MNTTQHEMTSASVCRHNVETRWKILEEILKCPEEANPAIIRSCASQVTFAAAAFPEVNIFPISRNSMYKYADILLADRFTDEKKSGRFYLDWLRKQVAGLGVKAAPFRSKAEKEQRHSTQIINLIEKLRVTEAALLIRGAAYLRLVQAFNLISRDPAIEESTRQRINNILIEQESLHASAFRDDEIFSDSNNVKTLKRK